ncbi:TolB-like translocation protein [Nocardioides pakistanensis]
MRLAVGSLFNPAISADGKVIAWTQYGGGHTGTGQAVYALEWQKANAAAELVSVGDDGAKATGINDYASLGGNGRYVAFQSMDKELDDDAVPGKEGGAPNKVYVRDRVAGETTMVSVTDDDKVINGAGIKPDITADGRYVAFASDASVLQGIEEGGEGDHSDLAAAAEEGETTTFQQVYVRDLTAGTTTPVSVGLPPEVGVTADTVVFGDGASAPAYGPSISDDGRYVAFESDATNLVAGDTNEDTDAFVRDLTAGTTVRVSLDEDGEQVDLENPEPIVEPEVAAQAEEGGGKPPEAGGGGEGEAGDITPNVGLGPVLSGNGRFVVFESKAALTADDENGWLDEGDPATEEDDEWQEPVDIYRVGLAAIAFSIERMSVANDDPDAFEATGYRADSHGEEGATIVPTNGADPAIDLDGNSVAFVSNGNLDGHEVAEEGEDEGGGGGGHESSVPTVAATEEPEPEAPTSIEPSVYVRNTTGEVITPPAPPPPPPGPISGSDTTAPVSKASAPAVSTAAAWEVTYTATDDSSGVAKVELFVKLPGAATFVSAGVDTTSLDGKFAFASGGVEGDYAFYTVATDKSGNIEAVPATPDAVTEYAKPGPVVTDVAAPVSKAMSPRFARHDSFKVRYTARDEKAGSGLAKVELFVKTPGAASYTKVATDAGPAIDKVFGYTASAGEGAYRFYTVATDVAGNVEKAPAKADTVTIVDETPAVAKRRMGKGPFVLDLGDRDRLMLRLRINERSRVTFFIRHEGKLVKQFGPKWSGKGLVTRHWNGRDLDKKLCEPGGYVLVMKVQDRAGNTTLLRTRIHVVG